MNDKKINSKGFTLIELLVVATIIVVLSAIGLVSFSNAGKSARNSKRKADLETVRQALVLYKSENPAGYPAGDYNTMIGVLGSGFISEPTPVDPKDSDTNASCLSVLGSAVNCGYIYTRPTATTFILTAPLEGESAYEVRNP